MSAYKMVSGLGCESFTSFSGATVDLNKSRSGKLGGFSFALAEISRVGRRVELIKRVVSLLNNLPLAATDQAPRPRSINTDWQEQRRSNPTNMIPNKLASKTGCSLIGCLILG